MNEKRFTYLFTSYFNRITTPAEENELMELTAGGDHDTLALQLIGDTYESVVPATPQNKEHVEKIFSAIVQRKETYHRPVKLLTIHRQWGRAVAAAVIVCCLSIGIYYMSRNSPRPNTAPVASSLAFHDIAAPKTSKARITLSDGKTVALESVASGVLAHEGGVYVTKTAEGKIIYSGRSDETGLNTLTNPRGSNVVDITLADGSQVWLNAGSSITYPVAFTGAARTVNISGEAYFEVAHDAARPFIVTKGTMQVQVLGTHFNVNSYEDEDAIKVTLLEGSVRVADGEKIALIKPGEQARVRTGDNIGVSRPDLHEVMAWRDGKFRFGEGADIQSIMRQIARWYDVDVAYVGTVKGHIGGTISRTATAGEVFRMLEMTGVIKFKIDGKKVTVMN